MYCWKDNYSKSKLRSWSNKKSKNVIRRFDFKIAHNAINNDNWLVIQKLNLTYYVKGEDTTDNSRKRKSWKLQQESQARKFFFDMLERYHNMLPSDEVIVI